MGIKRGEWLLIIFNLVYILAFTAYYIAIRNFEFMWYIVIMLVFFAVLAFTLRKTKFSYKILWGLSIWGIAHMAGGGLVVKGQVLYALRLIPIYVTESFYVLKYDQLVHGYLYFVMVFVVWHLLKTNLNHKRNYWILYPVVALTGIGIGALNEIAEFIPVLLLKETGVGGYFNTLWDIVANTIGSIIGIIVLYFSKEVIEAG